MKRTARTRTDKAAATLLAGLVVGSVLAAGSVHAGTFLSVAAAALIGTALLWLTDRDLFRDVPVPWPALVLAALALWSALQALPLPAKLLASFAPRNADVWARALRPLAEAGPSWTALSLDPGASLFEAGKWSSYAVIFVLAASVGRRWGGIFGAALAFSSSTIVAIVTLAHGLVGAQALFGVYTPRFATPVWGVAPLLNPNNLSGYLNLGALCGVGFLISRREFEDTLGVAGRFPVAAGISLVVASSALAASRAGTVALGVGIVVLAILVRFLRSRRTSSEPPASLSAVVRQYAWAGIALAGGLLLAVLGASAQTWTELQNTSAEKAKMIAWSAPLIHDYPWFGIGRGAFETVFPAYREQPGHVVFTHPENFLVQWLVEWGVPVSVVATAALVWALRPSMTGIKRNRAALAAAVGVAVVLIQNLADLALEVPGVTIALIAVLGSLWGGARRKGPRSNEAETRSRFRLDMAVIVGASAFLWFGAAHAGRWSALEDRLRLHESVKKTRAADLQSFETLKKELRGAMLRHPGDPYFPLLGAVLARRTRGQDPMPWIAACLERDPMSGRAHFLLAQILAGRGARRQALMELRFAVEREEYLANLVAKHALAWSNSTDELLEIAPGGRIGSSFLWVLARELSDPKRIEQRTQLLDAAIARDGSAVNPRVLRAQDLMTGLEHRRPPCGPGSEAACRQRLSAELAQIELLDPGSCTGPLVRSRLLELDRAPGEAAKLLTQRCVSCREADECLHSRLALAGRHGTSADVSAAATALLANGCSSTASCAAAHSFVGQFHAGRQEWASASKHLDEAAARHQTADAYLRAADAAARAGRFTRARVALTRAQVLGARDPALEARIQQLQEDAATHDLQGGSP